MNTANFNTIFLSLKHELYAYVLGILRDEDQAKDAIQDLYERLFKNRLKIEKAKAAAYFFRSARNYCIDIQRRKFTQTEIDFSLSYGLIEEDKFEKQELQTMFRRLVNELPKNLREVIFLSDVCELSTKEVVGVLESNENKVRVTLSRARAKIKEQLIKYYSYEG